MNDDLAAVLGRYAFFKYRYDHDPGLSTWLGHLAFAYILVAEARPRLIVELGTQFGHSFFAFCQSVRDNGVPAVCCAVDTWRGDEHTGDYDDRVFERVREHAGRYADFVRLYRMTFDEAAAYFPGADIDVLHIDGLHTYEAVRHDFELWYPRVRPGGFVLFHDVCVVRDDFGVYRFWNETAPRFPEAALFTHSCGLGVLRKPGGDRLESPLLREVLDFNSPHRNGLADYFRKLSAV